MGPGSAPWSIDKEKKEKNKEKKVELVYHPAHYGGGDYPYEAIKVIEAWDLGFCLGNTVKYIARAGKKDETLQELEKALWYLQREIQKLKSYAKKDTKTS